MIRVPPLSCARQGWRFKDRREYYVLRVQTFWRARVAKRRIRLLAKAKRLLENAHRQDLADTKQDIAALCNYTLHVHAVLHDYDRARGLYVQMVDFMHLRGVDNAFVLYSTAIFGAVTNEEDWEEIKDFARRAQAADEQLQKRRSKDGRDARGPRSSTGSSYRIAAAAFYLQSMCNEGNPAESWHNYALCQMLVHRDLEGARDSFLRAMRCRPRDRRIISNFDTLLQDEEFMGEPTRNAHEEYLRNANT